MNILGLIFSVLITITIVVSALFEKQLSTVRIHSTSAGHIRANRKILRSCEKELYKEIFPISHLTHPIIRSASKTPHSADRDSEFPKANPLCARLNLSPLLHEGKEVHPVLYEMALKLFQTFYGKTLFKGELAGAEMAFFEAFLSSLRAQKKMQCSLEKLSFANSSHRKLYYQMLKGTKECDLFQGIGYPALLDYICFEDSPSKPCLFHAHPHLTTAFFGPKVALQLHRMVHRKNGTKLSQPLIEQLCFEAHHFPEKGVFELFELSSCGQKPFFTSFIESDAASQVSLKKEISSS